MDNRCTMRRDSNKTAALMLCFSGFGLWKDCSARRILCYGNVSDSGCNQSTLSGENSVTLLGVRPSAFLSCL